VQSYLNAITRPSPNTYAAELGNAAWLKVWIGVGVVALISLLGALLSAARAADSTAQIDQTLQQLRDRGYSEQTIQSIKQFAQFLINLSAGGGAIGSVPWTVVTFFLGAGVMFMVARVLGGSGSGFMTHAYLLSLSYTPLKVILGILGLLVALAGASSASLGLGCIAFLLNVLLYGYMIYSAGLSMQVSQRLPSGRAQLAAFAPVLSLLVIACFACLALTLAIVGAASRTQ
jgi:hypothetical protein